MYKGEKGNMVENPYIELWAFEEIVELTKGYEVAASYEFFIECVFNK